MRDLIYLFTICVLFIFQFGCCTSPNDISGLWSRGTGATTAPESATFANQGLYLGQQSRYISPPSSDAVVAVPAVVAAPLPNATPTPNPVNSTTVPATVPPTGSFTPVAPATQSPSITPQPATIIPTPDSNSPYINPFNTSATVPNTVPATPTITELPANYLAASTPAASTTTKPQDSPFAFISPKAEVASPSSPVANNAVSGSISPAESLFAPTQTNNNAANINPTPTNPNVPLTAYEIAAAGTAETAYQSIKTRAGTQIKTSQNGTTTITTAAALPVTSNSHFVTDVIAPE
ncbi:MAG: hypothetical protein LBL39_01385 [Planctomycetaceae bacterium]|jgi:hypothetical protein|nr:hypothetical protein [Planctomycetaceae bacterium]